MPRTRTVIIALLFLMLPAAAGAETWTRSYDVGNRPRVALQTDDGNVRVVRGPARRVSFTVTTTGWRIAPGEVTVASEQRGNAVSLRVREPRFRFDFGGSLRRGVEVEVVVPSDLDLDVVTGDGNITLPALRGSIGVRTGDGNVDADGLRGDLHIASGDGRVFATDLDGHLDARTGDGRIQVRGRFDELDLGTGDGPVKVDVLPGSRPAAPWSITTGDGSILLRLPADLKVDLDLHTGDGHIDLDLPITIQGRINRRSIRGPLNGGGPTLRLRTGDGPIRVEKLES